MSFQLVLCEREGCTKRHGVVAVKRRHAAYTGPVVSPLRDLGDGLGTPLPSPSPGPLTRP
jgi:hypothetical protein